MRLAILIACLLLAASPVRVEAQTIFQTGFEAPTYADGNLVSQDGWQSTDSPPTPGRGTVQSVFARLGVRSVKLDASVAFSSAWYYQILNYLPTPSTAPIVQISWDMYLTDTGVTPSFLWGIDVYDNTPFASRRITAVGVNSAGRLQVWDNDRFFDTGVIVSRNAWHTFKINIDYRAGRKWVVVTVDDQVAAVAKRISTVAAEFIADVDLYHIDGGGEDSAFYDNFSVLAQADGDLDGIPDVDDLCPATAAGEAIDASGCSIVDSDGDGVANDFDLCPGTPACTLSVDSSGCPDLDSDGDGAFDGCDNCPGVFNPDQADADGDGEGDACDLCPDLAFGDVNGDMSFNGGDVQRMVEIIISGTSTQPERCAADFNEDEVIDLDDVPLFVNFLLQI